MRKSFGLKLALLLAAPLAPLVPTNASMAQAEAKIQVVSGSYGYAGNRKDVKDDVAKLCDQKSSCTFLVANETFNAHMPTDPSPGDDKSIIFSWKCGDAPHKDSAAEHRKASLSCK